MEQTEQNAAPDAFQAALTLIALAADPAAAKARLQELQKAVGAAARASAELDAKRRQHDAEMAAERAEIVEQRRAGAELWALAEKAELEEQRAYIAEMNSTISARLGELEPLGGGLTRSWVGGRAKWDETGPDADERQVEVRDFEPSDDETETERVPMPSGIGTGLTRSQPRRRGGAGRRVEA